MQNLVIPLFDTQKVMYVDQWGERMCPDIPSLKCNYNLEMYVVFSLNKSGILLGQFYNE